jgi:cytochrome c2
MFEVLNTNYRYSLLIFLFLSGCNSPVKNNLTEKEKIKEGDKLFHSVGCTTCHSIEGKLKYGPPLNSIFHTEIHVIREGEDFALKVDRAYIQRSILTPDYEKLREYKSKKMPKTDLSSEEIDNIAEYLISINEK